MFLRNVTLSALLLAVASAHPAVRDVENGKRSLHWDYSSMAGSLSTGTAYASGTHKANTTGSYTIPSSSAADAITKSSSSYLAGPYSSNGACTRSTTTVTEYETITRTTSTSTVHEQTSSAQPLSSSHSQYAPVSAQPLSSQPLSTSAAAYTTKAKATTASSSAPKYSPTPKAPKPASGGKRGIISSPDAVVPLMADYSKISWAMNWWEGPTNGTPDGWMFLPELTHLDPDQYFHDTIAGLDPKQSPYLAGFLEPGGENVNDAVQSWKTNLEPLSGQFTLIPPIVGQNDLAWLQEFTKACDGCSFGGPIAYTIYVSPDDAGVADFKNHLHDMMAAYPGQEIWVANFGVLTGTTGDPEWLMRQLVPYLDSMDIVTHYAWAGDQTFMDGSQLTDLAKLYGTL